MKTLKEKVAELPDKPGCYLFKNKNKKIIYIGKAKNLRKRVVSYFAKSTFKNTSIVENSVELEYYLTSNEVEALILENNLIKKHKPKYNVNLKDDKSYPYIELTQNEKFPGIYFSRKPINKNSQYFGPYPSSGAVKRLISLIEKYFLIRTCKKNFSLIKRPCLKFHINRCSAPCVKYITENNYSESAKMAQMFLEGKYNLLEQELAKEMEKLSEELKYEKAAEIRDILLEIKKFKASQFADIQGNETFDVIAFSELNDIAAIIIFHFKSGRLIDKSQFILNNEDDIFQTFLEQYFYNLKFTVDKYYLNIVPENLTLLTNYLKHRFNKKIDIRIPQKGKFLNIVKSAYSNCIEFINQQLSYKIALNEMKKALELKNVPIIIECIDISHSSGTFTVGSVVRFNQGKPEKKNYRRYKIKETVGVDDFKSISEVVNRHYGKLIDTDKPLPDLIVIDGGKGQLMSAATQLNDLKIYDRCDLISLAKKEETIFSDKLTNGLQLNMNLLFSRILIKLRDEAHRFAITYNRKLRNMNSLKTELIEIKGIGKIKATKLLNRFKSIENIKNANNEDLKEILSKKDIENLKLFF